MTAPERAPSLRDHIIAVSGQLFYAEGIRGVGIDRIINASGVAKATLYKHFRSKDELVVAYLESRHQRVIDAMHQNLLGPTATVQAQVNQVFRILENKAIEDETFRGCAFLIAVAEYGGNEQVVDVARHHKACIREIFETILHGHGGPTSDLSNQLALLYDGALAQIMIYRAPEPARYAAQSASRLIQDMVHVP